MPKNKFLASSAGSAPLELASLVALLLVPLGPMLILYQEIFDAIAAESIARHSLRAAILGSAGTNLDAAVAESIDSLSRSWQKEASFQLDCGRCAKGDLVSLQVQVGNSIAIQVAGLEPK